MNQSLAYSKLLAGIEPTIPFKGPNALERELGVRIRLRLGANESAHGISPVAEKAIQDTLHQINWYGDPQCFDLKIKLASLHGIKREDFVIGNGIDELLALTLRVFLDPGEGIALSAGTYPTVRYLAAGCGAVCHSVPYKNFRIDVDGLIEAAIRERVKLVYVGNPDNPTGSFLEDGAIDRLLQELPKNCLLLLDEAYIEFAEDAVWNKHGPLHDRVIRFRTFSKAHGLPGLRIGYVMAAAAHVTELNKIRLQFSVNRIAQAAALASMSDVNFVSEVVRRNREGRRDYYDLAWRLGLDVIPSSTNFVSIVFEKVTTAEEVWRRLMNAGVFTHRPATLGLDRCLRVTVGNSLERAEFRKTFISECSDLFALTETPAELTTPALGQIHGTH